MSSAHRTATRFLFVLAGLVVATTLSAQDGNEVGGSNAPSRPRITGCSPKVLSNGTLCVCGSFPTAASRNSLTLNGQPLGAPGSAENHVLRFAIPEGTPPGEFTVGGLPTGGFAPGDSAGGIHIAVGGDVDQDKLRRGQSTPLRLWVYGTSEPVSLRLANRTPNIISLTGGDEQVVTTSGGENNEVVRTVRGLRPGNFELFYELDLDTCPCEKNPAPPENPGIDLTDPPTTGTTTRSALPGPCDELKKRCDELRQKADELTRTAARLRSAADRASEDADRYEADVDWLAEVGAKDRAYADKMKEQAKEWRDLAADSRASAEKNRKRNEKYPGRNWDYWEAKDRAEAERREAEAERIEQRIRDLEAKAKVDSAKAARLRALIREANEAAIKATEAELAARQARAAYEACLQQLAVKCPDAVPTTGGSTTTTSTGGGTSTTSGGETGDDPRDTPPPTVYGEEDDEEKICPQRDGKHPLCVALLVDYARRDWIPGGLLETKGDLEQMGCEVDYASPIIRTVPPASYMTERTTFDLSELKFKTTPHWVDTRASRDPVVAHNRAQMAPLNAAIESHRAKLRKGAVMAIQMVMSHGSKGENERCGRWGPKADFVGSGLQRDTFHQANYKAAKGKVCLWYVADISCYSWQTPRAVDALNNEGIAWCNGTLPVDRSYHAGFEADIAHSCGNQNLLQLCHVGDGLWLTDDIEDAFEDEQLRQRRLSYGSSSAFRELIPELQEAANSSVFNFGTYADKGYEMCVPETHVKRGPYWE